MLMHTSKYTSQVAGLRRQAAAGTPLPETVLIRGHVKARGAPVQSVAVQIPQLQPLIGSIDQPKNLYLDLAAKVKTGSIKLPPGYEKLGDDIENIEDDFSQRTAVLGSNLVISELFITRLGCEASKKEQKDKEGNVKITIERAPQAARFNVLHHRQVADGLHLVDTDGESADLVLPSYGENDLKKGESPSLFLTLPDALNEFKRFYAKVWNVINADKPLTHLSRFIHLDQRSHTDNGSFTNLGEGIMYSGSENALDSIGRLVPNGWLWSGKGFYDNRPGHWSSYPNVELLDYATFRQRIPIAARENARSQDATEMSFSEMESMRDRENCFRVVELGVASESAVVVLGKPQLIVSKDGGASGSSFIVIGAPNATSDNNITDPRFLFRILKGHTVDNLIKHRNASLLVYLGFAAMGAMTVAAGEEQIRDSLEVHYR